MLLVFLNILHLVQTSPLLFDNFTFFVNGDCSLDQQLLVYDSSTSALNRHPICSQITTSQIDRICQLMMDNGDACSGTNGIVVNTTATENSLALSLNEHQLLFETGSDCSTRIICYNESTQCTLPSVSNGVFRNERTNEVVQEGRSTRVSAGDVFSLECTQPDYTWYWSDTVSCFTMSDSATAALSGMPECIPAGQTEMMEITINTSTIHVVTLTGVSASLLEPNSPESVLSDSRLMDDVYCNNTSPCSIPVQQLNVSSDHEYYDDYRGSLMTEYTDCLNIAILTVFFTGLGTSDSAQLDIFGTYDTRPMKREVMERNIQVRIQSMDLLFDRETATWQGIVVKWHMLQFTRVIPPSVVAKVMHLVPAAQYKTILEGSCRLKHCPSFSENECGDVPVMLFTGYPKPNTPCTVTGNTVAYGEEIPLKCGYNQFISETQTTLCLYSHVYNPPAMPTCKACGGIVTENYLTGPRQAKTGRNTRGTHCAWEIETGHATKGQVYIGKKEDMKRCQNPVSFLKITQYNDNGVVISETTDICIGVEMKLSSRFKFEFTSNSESDALMGFTFAFEPDVPPQPWYKKYLAVLIAAPAIVLFFFGLVFLGVYCDHRNKKLLESPVVPVEEGPGDTISNGTWRHTSNYKNRQPLIPEDSIVPQPRIHNAVTAEGERPKKKKKRKVTPTNDTTDSKGGTAKSGTTLRDTWVTQDDLPSPDVPQIVVDNVTQVNRAPGEVAPPATEAAPPATETTEVSPTPTRRKKRRRKKRGVERERPLPPLTTRSSADTVPLTQGGGETPPPFEQPPNPLDEESVYDRALPARPLPPIGAKNSPHVTFPFVPTELGVD